MSIRGYIWLRTGILLALCAALSSASAVDRRENPNELRYERQQDKAREARQKDAEGSLPLTLPEDEPAPAPAEAAMDSQHTGDLSHGTTAAVKLSDVVRTETSGTLDTSAAANSLTVRVATREGGTLDEGEPVFEDPLVSATAKPSVKPVQPPARQPQASESARVLSIRGGQIPKGPESAEKPTSLDAMKSNTAAPVPTATNAEQLQSPANTEPLVEAVPEYGLEELSTSGTPSDSPVETILAPPGPGAGEYSGNDVIDDSAVSELLAGEPDPLPSQSEAVKRPMWWLLGSIALILVAVPAMGLMLARERSSRKRRRLALIEAIRLGPEHQLLIIESHRYALVLGLTPATTYQLQKVSMSTLGMSYRQTIARILEREGTAHPEDWRNRSIYNGPMRPLLTSVAPREPQPEKVMHVSLTEMRNMRAHAVQTYRRAS